MSIYENILRYAEEKGKGSQKIEKLSRIADYFGVPVTYFLEAQ